ncbi:beta-ketoacyl-ACP synthase II [bacterium]|nr:beta-ketoacyl-ACP synthase II [bacterium]
MPSKRAVITGLSLLTPLGVGVDKNWRRLLKGESGISQITFFDASAFSSQIGGEVRDFNPEEYIDKREVRRMDRFAQFSVAAAKMALADAGLEMERLKPEEVAVIMGSGIGGIATWEEQHRIFLEKGPNRVSPFFIPMLISDMAAAHIAIAFKAMGANYATVSACASGANAIGEALRLIREERAKVVIAGGSEACVTPLALAGFCSMRALSTRNDEPEKASRPFDAKRDGFVLSEGAGVVIVEEMEFAKKRGARIYAELLGYGLSCDAYHITAPEPNGKGAVLSMEFALKDAGISKEDVDYINAHGTSTQLNDATETLAIKKVFGQRAYEIPISSTKSMIGHLLGAAGAVEFVVSLLSIRDNIIHPTINYEYPDPDCDLDYVPNKARETKVDVIMSNSFGFGGHNVTLVAKRFE